MSTKLIRRISRHYLLAAGFVLAGSLLTSDASAQAANVEIRLLLDSNRVAIEVNGAPSSSWSFIDSYAGIVGLGRRVEHFTVVDETGADLPVKQTAPGQFKSESAAKRVRYEVNLKPVSRASDFSRMSWLDKDRGVLMLLDLLPVGTESPGASEAYRVHFHLNAPWSVHSTAARVAQDEFVITDAARAVFAVGANLRSYQSNMSGLAFSFVTNGEWSFSDAEVMQLSQQVLNAHRETFGSFPAGSAMLVLLPFPLAVSASEWSAETRDSTVTLLLGRMPSRIAALAQLSTPMTHELFHLWIPNGLKLQGNYDWFYEGFTIYQASQTAVKLGLLTFPEFLNAISRAYDASRDDATLSLIEASNRRFTTGLNSVYAKSQVIAFLYDLRLRSATRNKRSISDVYRKLMKRSDTSPEGSDGSKVAAAVLSEEIGSADFVHSFVENPISVNLAKELAPFGLVVDDPGFRTRISVSENLTKQQRDLLRELGYNAATHATR
jgi:predicted metalloprotease with PDZ domain